MDFNDSKQFKELPKDTQMQIQKAKITSWIMSKKGMWTVGIGLGWMVVAGMFQTVQMIVSIVKLIINIF